MSKLDPKEVEAALAKSTARSISDIRNPGLDLAKPLMDLQKSFLADRQPAVPQTFSTKTTSHGLSAGGTINPVSPLGGDNSTVPTDSQPFQFACLLRTIGSTNVRGIYAGSQLQQSYDHTDTLVVTGLLTSLDPDDTDPGWVATSTTDEGWLEIDIDSSVFPYTFSNATIKSLANGDSFDGGEFENDGGTGTPVTYNQTKARLVIYGCGADSNGDPFVKIQYVTSPLRMEFVGYANSKDSSGGSQQLIGAFYPCPTG